MPGQPIVPAYAQMAWVRELVNELSPKSDSRIEYFRWKFLNPILPGDEIEIKITWSTGKHHVVITRQDQKVTHGLLKLQEENV